MGDSLDFQMTPIPDEDPDLDPDPLYRRMRDERADYNPRLDFRVLVPAIQPVCPRSDFAADPRRRAAGARHVAGADPQRRSPLHRRGRRRGGGVALLVRALPSLWAAYAARSFSLAGAGLRTERDLPISLVLGGARLRRRSRFRSRALGPRLPVGAAGAALRLLLRHGLEPHHGRSARPRTRSPHDRRDPASRNLSVVRRRRLDGGALQGDGARHRGARCVSQRATAAPSPRI